MRNLLALPYLARGTPMLAMGAELGHSQNGNNNAYAQDNATTWIDWSKADASLIDFAGRLARIRRAHPALSRPVWLNSAPVGEGGPLDVEWRDADGPLTQASQWEAAGGDVLVVGLAARTSSGVDRVLVALNRSPGRPSAAPARRARRTRRGASFSTPTTIPSSTPRRRSPTGCASPAARRSRSPKSTRRRRACGRRRRARSNPSPKRRASPATGGTSPVDGPSFRPRRSSRCWRLCACPPRRRRRCARASPSSSPRRAPDACR